MLQFISGSVSGSIFNSNVEGNILGKGVIVIFLLANIGLNENPLLLTCNERNSVKNNFRKSESNWKKQNSKIGANPISHFCYTPLRSWMLSIYSDSSLSWKVENFVLVSLAISFLKFLASFVISYKQVTEVAFEHILSKYLSQLSPCKKITSNLIHLTNMNKQQVNSHWASLTKVSWEDYFI